MKNLFFAGLLVLLFVPVVAMAQSPFDGTWKNDLSSVQWPAKPDVLLDRRLFLPEEWANDAEPPEEAGVPEDVVFRTKPELALEMVREAEARGVPFRWVGGDSLYGDSPCFVQGIRE